MVNFGFLIVWWELVRGENMVGEWVELEDIVIWGIDLGILDCLLVV